MSIDIINTNYIIATINKKKYVCHKGSITNNEDKFTYYYLENNSLKKMNNIPKDLTDIYIGSKPQELNIKTVKDLTKNKCMSTLLLKKLGHGVQSHVYHVCDKHNCNYVLKILNKKEHTIHEGEVKTVIYTDEEVIDKIKKEKKYMKYAEKLGVPIPKLHNSDYVKCKINEENGYGFIMEKLDGEVTSLLDMELEENILHDIIKQVIEILQKLWNDGQKTLVHGDTKPCNFLYKYNKHTNKYKIYLTDFGVAYYDGGIKEQIYGDWVEYLTDFFGLFYASAGYNKACPKIKLGLQKKIMNIVNKHYDNKFSKDIEEYNNRYKKYYNI